MVDYELRSEEEYVGNLLWVVTERGSDTSQSCLKSLWIEAEEYTSHEDQAYVLKLYDKDAKKFKNAEISFAEFEARAGALLKKVMSYEQSTGYISGTPIGTEKLDLPQFDKNVIVTVLEDDFSTFTAFLFDSEIAMLFCWNDVI